MATFENDDEAKAWADEWVQPYLPSPLVLDISDGEREHFTQFDHDYGRLVGQVEVQFSALAELVDQVNFIEKSSWPPHRSMQFVLVAYNVKSFYSALDRLARGYYEDCFTITRGLYETFVRLLWISCHANDAYAAVVRKPPTGVPQFNLTGFLRDELKLTWESHYSVLSAFAHSNSYQVLRAIRRIALREGEPERFGVTVEYKPELTETAAPLLQFVLLAHLRFVIDRLIGESPQRDAAALTLAQQSVDLLTYGLRSHPRDRWREAADDLDALFTVLEVADRGGDWKAMVAARAKPIPPDTPADAIS